jgi:hypothetical protein
MERIAIIDHDTHTLFVEDIDEDILNTKYDGEEEAYIKDNYPDIGEHFSWDYIVDTCYTPIDGDSIDVEFEDLL